MKSQMKKNSTLLEPLYDLITGDEDARVCKEIPDEACKELPKNFFIHVCTSVFTKIGDELASPKLILAWLLAALGAPGFMAGLLVPIRESAALLPQLVVAGYLRKVSVRKWFWIGGSFFEGLAVLGMALTATIMDGALAGWVIVALLLLFSLSRGVRSVASKDVLGKTVSKSRRGTLMGIATAIAGLFTVGFGFYTKLFLRHSESQDFFIVILISASLLWFLAAFVFSFLSEPAGATDGGGNAGKVALQNLKILERDRPFRHFVLTRALLLSTALSAPFYVVLAKQATGGSLSNLGLLIIAAGLSGSLSAPVWGRFADRSSRLVMVAAALIAFGLGIMVFFLGSISVPGSSSSAFAVLFFILGVAHSGIRLGRKTYLIDMSTTENRAAYVALSNTIIGILIIAGGMVGLLSFFTSTEWIILLLAIMAGVGAVSAWQLKEVS